MKDAQNLISHTKWERKYHIVFIPNYRRLGPYKELWRYLGELFREMAGQRESAIEEDYLMPDHVHMLVSIPPDYSVAQVVGFIKGKGAIHVARAYLGRRRGFRGQNLWARSYYVSTVGRDERTIRNYIHEQEREDRRIEHNSA